MKKYITIAALLAAGTAFANAGEVLDIIEITNKGSSWVEAFGGLNPSADSVAANLASCAELSQTGWYRSTANQEINAISVVQDITADGFTLIGRYNYGGAFVASTVELEDVLQDTETLTALTLSFTATTVNSLYFSLWSWDGETAKRLDSVKQAVSANNEVLVALDNLELTSDDTVFALWGSNSGGGFNVITGIGTTFTVIPEPSAFGLLAGLGALALVGTRRRRK